MCIESEVMQYIYSSHEVIGNLNNPGLGYEFYTVWRWWLYLLEYSGESGDDCCDRGCGVVE